MVAHSLAWYQANRAHQVNIKNTPLRAAESGNPQNLPQPKRIPTTGFASSLNPPVAKMAAVASATEDIPPNNTYVQYFSIRSRRPIKLTEMHRVYVRNLEERIKIPALTEALNELFSDYGNILDLVAKPSLKRKGQAFIVFDDVSSASNAIDELNGFEVFDKPMKLAYAKTPSDAFVQAKASAEEFESHRRHRLAEKERKQAQEAQQDAQNKLKRPPPEPQSGAQRQGAAGGAAPPAKKPAKGAGLKSTGGAGAVVPDEYLPPNKILFVQNVPEDYDVEMLSAVFARFEGFREVRTVPGRTGIAFVEYEAETGAISAKEATAGMPLGDGKAIKVTFQRQ